ncbi:MAG: type II toxin-antitoxin system RelE/ParE family toxin [Nitrospinota bacterium]
MSYNVFLSSKAEKQYSSLDKHIQHKFKSKFSRLKEEPRKSFFLSGKYAGLRYIKIFHKGVEYRTVYDICDEKKEVLILFLGTRENFYKEIRRHLR